MFAVYVLIHRPFEMTRDNIREVISEVMVSGYAILFIYLHKKSAWDDTVAYAYIYTSTGNVFIGFVS
ncbi:unnamed protein product [Moneuplotes crassus]|uniref:Uncharacterized protein n=1 Tax=Euplotes crassus TaxID=5936 RepID=A0AAD1Y920_EUPCR|nr:unnamed protein product [Moneuplotes crassus]